MHLLPARSVMTVYAVVDGLIPACIYGSLNFAGTINIPRISQQWNKRPCSPRTGIEQEPIESSTVLFCEDAVGLLLFSGPNRRYPWKQKLAIVRLFCLKLHWSTFFSSLLPPSCDSSHPSWPSVLPEQKSPHPWCPIKDVFHQLLSTPPCPFST